MANYYVVINEKLNLIAGMWAPLVLHVKQYDGDYTRQMQFTLYYGDEEYTIPKQSTVVISGTKQDHNGFSYYGTYNGSTVTVPLMQQMTAYDGSVPCEITLLDKNNNQIGTATFILYVEKAALEKSTLESSNDFKTLTRYLDDTRYYEQLSQSYAVGKTGIRRAEDIDNSEYYATLARMYKGSPLVVDAAANMTEQDRVYVYVGNESGYVNGNWYYYDGTAWVSGGVYNSTAVQTDKTLSVEDVAADAKAVGDRFNETFYLNFVELLDDQNAKTTGDCSLIRLPDGTNVLIDFGKNESVENTVSYFQQLGIESIETAVISHMHSDHIGETSFRRLATEFSIQKVYIPEEPNWSLFHDGQEGWKADFSAEYQFIRDICTELDIELIVPLENETVHIGAGDFTFFNCSSAVYTSGNYYEFTRFASNFFNTTVYNNFSMCVKLQCLGKTVYYTGDIEYGAQGYLTSLGYFEPCDVLKIPHHMANSEEDLSFFASVNADYGIAMSGFLAQTNSIYGYLARFVKRAFTTYYSGSIELKITRTRIEAKETTPYGTLKDMSKFTQGLAQAVARSSDGTLRSYINELPERSETWVYGTLTDSESFRNFSDIPANKKGGNGQLTIHIEKPAANTSFAYTRITLTYSYYTRCEIYIGVVSSVADDEIRWNETPVLSTSAVWNYEPVTYLFISSLGDFDAICTSGNLVSSRTYNFFITGAAWTELFTSWPQKTGRGTLSKTGEDNIDGMGVCSNGEYLFSFRYSISQKQMISMHRFMPSD